MVTALPSYIPLPEAARRLGLPETRLKSLIDVGKIKAIEINGEIAVSEASVIKIPRKPKRQRISQTTDQRKEDLPEYKKFAELGGVKIGVGESARKYNVPQPTISRWISLGYIEKLEQTGQKVLINEQDIAFCAEIYHTNAGQGKWLFNKDGTPYQHQTH